MADNTLLNSGSGGDTLATDDIGGIKYPRSKIVIGADGSNDGDVSSANPLPVSLATVPSHAVTNAGTFAVQAAQSGTWNVTNVSGTVSLPTGAATSANQSTIITSLQLIDNAVVTDAGSALDGAMLIAGSDGANTRFLACDGNGILSVACASVASHAVTNAGTFAVQVNGDALTSLQLIDDAVQTEDAAHSTGQKGMFALSVRSDTAASTAGTDGDYAALTTDSTGRLHVNVGNTVTVGSHAVTNAGTFAVQVDGSALTALQLIDNIVQAEGAVHGSGDSGVMALVVRQDSQSGLGADGDYVPMTVDADGGLRVSIVAGAGSGGTALADDAAFTAATTSFTPVGGIVTADSVDSGDGGAFAMLANRQQKVTLYDSSGVELSVGGGTQYDEDAAHSTGSKVTGCGIVRKDTAAALAGTDGDYTLPISDASGKLWVNAEVTVALPSGTNAIGKLAANSGVDIGDTDVTSIVPGTGATNLGKAEDAAHSSGDTGIAILGVRRDTAASGAGADGDYATINLDATGRVWVHDPVSVALLTTIDADTSGIITAVQLLDDAVISSGAAVGTSKGLLVAGSDGDNVNFLSCDTSGFLAVNVQNTISVNSHAVTNAGTFAVQESGGALTALQIMDDWDNAASDGASVSGDVAHDSADAGEPVKVGYKATTSLSGLTLVANNDRTNGFAGVDGVPIVRCDTNLEDVVQERTTNTDGASTAFASGLAAPGAGIRLWIKSVTICNSSASFCTVDLRDGSAGSVLWTFPVPATGGVTHVFDPPLKLTANTALAFDASAATSTITISANGFKSKV